MIGFLALYYIYMSFQIEINIRTCIVALETKERRGSYKLLK